MVELLEEMREHVVGGEDSSGSSSFSLIFVTNLGYLSSSGGEQRPSLSSISLFR